MPFISIYLNETMIKKLSGLLFAMVMIWGCSIKQSDNPVSANDTIKPCPESPNCVSTLARNPRQVMPALPFIGSKEQSKQRIIEIIQSLKRSEIVKISDRYMHIQFRSRLFGFIDDVEFQFDDAARSVHFRSASRSGYYDFGVNRRRMSKISKCYLAK